MAEDEEDAAAMAEAEGESEASRMALGWAHSCASEAYLRKRAVLVDLQIENLRKLDEYETSHLRWRRFNDQMKGVLQMMLAAVGALVVVAIAAAVWNAAHDNGLVIEAFSVPPDLAAKGITGEVVATRVLDRLAAFQAQTVSGRASASYANNWGDDIKVQIPDTGVSIGEFNRYLQQWLGHQTRISGEIYRTPTGLAVTARAGSDSSPVFTGSEAQFDSLIEKAAEHIYRSTQPYRYAIFLFDHKRYAEDKAVLQQIVDTGSPLERAWAYNGMGANAETKGDYATAIDGFNKAIHIDPSLMLSYNSLMNDESSLQHDEQTLAAARKAAAAIARGDSSMSAAALANVEPEVRGNIAYLTGDMQAVSKALRDEETLPDFNGSQEGTKEGLVQLCGLLHDAACLRMALAAYRSSSDPGVLSSRILNLQLANIPLQRWRDVLKNAPLLYAGMLKDAATRMFAVRQEAPLYAIAAAHLGDFALAHRLIDTTPADCVICLRARGQVAAVEKRWGAAGYWFGRAVRAAPSTPFGYTDWGGMLLAKGDVDGAIAKFSLAHEKGPHFADPLEMWGEALIARNRSDLALAKFEEANKYAPNWGRLHLKWGEALWWSGDHAGAQKQFAVAGSLDLTPAEKSVLSKVSHG
jgi:tetratricopeptide (TPR) repeat protein